SAVGCRGGYQLVQLCRAGDLNVLRKLLAMCRPRRRPPGRSASTQHAQQNGAKITAPMEKRPHCSNATRSIGTRSDTSSYNGALAKNKGRNGENKNARPGRCGAVVVADRRRRPDRTAPRPVGVDHDGLELLLG